MKEKSIRINAVLNVAKQLCSLVFPLITLPYVSRVLLAENYGRYSFSNSIIGYLSLIAGLGISSYAVREGARIRDNRERIEEFSGEIFSINVLSTLCAYVLLILIILLPSFREYSALMAVQGIGLGLSTIGADWINSIYEDYIYITVRYIVFQVLSVALLFLFVRDADDYVIYALVHVVSSAGANLLNVFHVRTYVRLHFSFSRKLVRHLKPILILFANSVALTVYINSDVTVLGLFKGDGAVGIYSVAAKIYLAVKGLMNAAVFVVAPRLSFYLGHKEKERMNVLLNKVAHSLLVFLIPSVTGLFVLSYPVIAVIGGMSYVLGTWALRLLCIAMFFAVSGCFYACAILTPMGLEKYYLRATMIGALINIGCNLVLIPFFSYNGAALTTAVSEMVVCLILRKYARQLVELRISRRTWITVLSGSVWIFFICYLAVCYISNTAACIAVSVGIGVLGYMMLLLIAKDKLVTGLMDSYVRKIFGKRRHPCKGYVIYPYAGEVQNHAGSKFPADVVNICRSIGFLPLELGEYGKHKMKRMKGIFQILCMRPHRSVIYIEQGLVGMYWLSVIDRIKRAKLYAIIEDLNSVRYTGDTKLPFEQVKRLNSCKGIVSQNKRMSDLLKMNGVTVHIVEMTALDFLCSDNDKRHSIRKRTNSICYGGNLSWEQSGFIYELRQLKYLNFNIYGINLPRKFVEHNVHYKGSFSAEKCIIMLQGSWGLVWQGTTLNGDNDNRSAYYKYVCPHKFSMYMLSGLPVIVKSDSAMADFVREHNCGICVSTLYELEQEIKNVSDESYALYAKNALEVGNEMRQGKFLKTALEKFFPV